jgi:hypothetical protein
VNLVAVAGEIFANGLSTDSTDGNLAKEARIGLERRVKVAAWVAKGNLLSLVLRGRYKPTVADGEDRP